MEKHNRHHSGKIGNDCWWRKLVYDRRQSRGLTIWCPVPSFKYTMNSMCGPNLLPKGGYIIIPEDGRIQGILPFPWGQSRMRPKKLNK